MLQNVINVEIMDYLTEVRMNLQAATDRQAVARKEDARKARLAKIAIAGLLIGFAVFVFFCGQIG